MNLIKFLFDRNTSHKSAFIYQSKENILNLYIIKK